MPCWFGRVSYRLLVDYLGREGRLETAMGLAHDVSDFVDMVSLHLSRLLSLFFLSTFPKSCSLIEYTFALPPLATPLTSSVDTQEAFEECRGAVQALICHDAGPALAWCQVVCHSQ